LTVCALLIAPILAIVSLRLAPKIRRARAPPGAA
jgi:hypothetical protein